MQPPQRGAIAGRVYLYSNLMLNTVAWAAQHTFVRMCGTRRHPMGWSAEQDFHVMLLRVLFTYGTYVHWRNFMAVAHRLVGKKQQQGLVLERVAPGTFGVPGCRSSWWLSLDPAESKEAPPVKASCVLLYLHGGAFMAGAPRMYCPAYKLWMQQLRAQGVSMRILAVGYPLCPEHPFPAPVKAAAAAYGWLLGQLKAEGRNDTIILGGDSAGGNLVVACLAYLRDGTLGGSSNSSTSSTDAAAATAAPAAAPPPLPAGALLISPAVDFTASSVFGPKLAEYFKEQPSKQQQQQQPGADQVGGNDSAGFDARWDYIDADEGPAVAKHYVQAASMADMCNPYVSPTLLPSFKGLVQQKMAVVWGGVEVLAPDCARFASRVQADGVRVEVHVEKKQPHVYCVLPPRELLERGAEACRFEFENGRGQQLHGVEFIPPSGSKQWASLVWNHGVCEHKERYVPVFEQLANAGVAVYCFDVHGHGASEPKEASERGLIRSYKHLIDDLYTFVGVVEQRVGQRLPSGSTFLGGQSMGGLVAALGALRCQERWAGLVVFSGAMGVVWTLVLRIQAALGNTMAALMPKAQLVPAVDPDNLHPDKAVVQSFKDDPLVFKGNLRAQTGNELLKGIRYLEAHRQEMQLPVYVVHGTKDAVTDMNAVQAFVDGVSSTDKTFNKVDGGYHEMLMGEEKTGMAQGIIDWLRARIEKPWQQRQQAQDEQGVQRVPAAAEGPSGAKL